jgi:DNA polymerase-3 subunit delta'
MEIENSLERAFAELVGQPQAIELLTQAIARDRIAPAYLFTGMAGVGRSLAAECFLKLLLHTTTPRNHPDLLWVEPTYLHQGKRLTAKEAEAAGIKRKTAPLIRLEQVREISQFLARAPLRAPRSLVVIEQAEAMQEAAANALLKTLEEPGQATLILLAPAIESLLPTLVSRCQRIPFYGLSTTAVAQVLERSGYAEILQHPDVLALAQGSPGAAIAHWQQLQEISAELLANITQSVYTPRAALELARQIDRTVSLPSQLWLIDYLQQIYWRTVPTSATTPFLGKLEQARQYLNRNVQPRLVWEVTLLALFPNQLA